MIDQEAQKGQRSIQRNDTGLNKSCLKMSMMNTLGKMYQKITNTEIPDEHVQGISR
ncbi:hypothetical protein RchiOBHm_Chr5g0077761 [Rosa chinensis]|uniref:Uncharacterized protein n=1 Tax=Rosa chinensis TaxID=74649 RepID=A0A2P6QM29_ROSCH|nr:hypothetical protein RchiOBHm_Chr5g0077761 [Rosa chinensis]